MVSYRKIQISLYLMEAITAAMIILEKTGIATVAKGIRIAMTAILFVVGVIYFIGFRKQRERQKPVSGAAGMIMAVLLVCYTLFLD